MKKIISAIPLFLSLMLACDGFNGIFNERWSDRVVPVFKTGAGTGASGYTHVAGEDGHADMQWGARWPSPRFTDNGDNTITDNKTGLMWTKNANHGPLSWKTVGDVYESLYYISNDINVIAKPGGYSDWRLPNILELASLLNFGEATPKVWLENQGFTSGSVQNDYWSSTTFANNTVNAHSIGSSSGTLSNTVKTNPFYVWPVRGKKYDLNSRLLATGQTTSYASGDDGAYQMGEDIPTKRFYDNGDGTMTDRKTGLMWTKNANIDSGKLWPAALTYIFGTLNATTKLGGFSDWRLPNVEELKTLVHYGQPDNALWLNTQGFINVETDKRYWSSNTLYSSTAFAFAMQMNSGELIAHNKTNVANNLYVWPVRGGER